MEMTGKIIAALPMRSGRSAKGDWKSQQYVLETGDKYPMHLLFDIREGETLTVCFDPDAHQKDGRWFATNRAWNVKRD